MQVNKEVQEETNKSMFRQTMAAKRVCLETQGEMSEVGIANRTGNVFEARLLRALHASRTGSFNSLMMDC